MNRQLKWSLILLGGAVLIAALMIFLRPAPQEDEREDLPPLVEALPFEAASGPIPVLGSGTVQARDELTVSVEVAGRLTYVSPAFREGGTVAAGTTLLRIDPADFENAVRIAKADVAAQNVAVLEAQEEVEIARDELRRFAARETAATAQEAARILPPEGLSDNEATPLVGIESPQDTAPGLATREPQLRSAEASRERAQASLADAQLSLSRSRVRAPFRGLVRSEDAAVGTLVQPGQVLGSIVSTSAYEVRVSLTPAEAALIPGLLSGVGGRIPATVTYTYGGQTYRWDAFVARANPILDSATRNIEVFLQVPAPLSSGRLADGEDAGAKAPPLLLGAFVNASMEGSSVASYAAVPSFAVRPGNEIWVVRDNKLAVLPVQVIQRTDEIAYIRTQSLDEGGMIVISNLVSPVNGMPVRLAGTEAGEADE